MELGSVRELKAQVLDGLVVPTRASAASAPTTVAVGLVPRPKGFALAVRVTSADVLQLPPVEEVLRRYGGEAEVRVVGPVRAAAGSGVVDRGRCELVLRPGASVAHPDVTAGTLGAFVRDGAGRVLLLSNNHVLADTDRAQLGDAVLSPAPADGGRVELDRVGTLTAFQRLSRAGNVLDLAVAAVDDPAHVGGNEVPEGRLCGVVDDDVLDGLLVAKVGRTTGHTTGTVTAVELDGVTVDYGRGQVFSFDDCLEVEGDLGAFSDGGDSGSVVYDRDTLAAVGLLFAGSTAGGTNGAGLTFCNPAVLALRTAGVTLL